jgi:hypothetical protein
MQETVLRWVYVAACGLKRTAMHKGSRNDGGSRVGLAHTLFTFIRQVPICIAIKFTEILFKQNIIGGGK